MRAIVYHTYGPPDVLKLEDVQKPVLQDDEVLVEVHAASAAAGNWHLLRAKPFLVRFMYGLLRPKHKILGAGIAERVEAVGGNVKQFRHGDEVFGDLSMMRICLKSRVELQKHPRSSRMHLPQNRFAPI